MSAWVRWLPVSLPLSVMMIWAIGCSTPLHARSVLWEGQPVPLTLTVGIEQRVNFPEPVADLDVPVALEAASQIVLTPTGTLHWTADAPFDPARVLAITLTGTVYQFDVRAVAPADKAAKVIPALLNLIDPAIPATHTPSTAPATAMNDDQLAHALIPAFLKGGPPHRSPSYVDLSRFALAHYIGPARLIPKLSASAIPLRPIPKNWLRVQSRWLRTRPLAQWQIGAHYVTAVGVTNTHFEAVDFDPRALRGALLFVAPLHPTLGPKGQGDHTTVWAVITAQPFHQAIRSTLSNTARRR